MPNLEDQPEYKLLGDERVLTEIALRFTSARNDAERLAVSLTVERAKTSVVLALDEIDMLIHRLGRLIGEIGDELHSS